MAKIKFHLDENITLAKELIGIFHNRQTGRYNW